jgi:hypothetical protein
VSEDNSILRGAVVIDVEGTPTKLATLADAGLVPEGDDAKVPPMEIIARVFERPFAMDAHVVVATMAPPVGSTKPRNLPIGQYNIAVANKVTPQLLLAVIGNIIATSESAAVAVARIRLEVAGWTFETSTGQRG